MAAATAPTRPSGITTSAQYASTWGGAFDALEHVTDLMWPLSVRTFARMRHDPTLTSVLSAYRLPLMAARWEIDPRGASPEIVQICADSLGLPVRGQPEAPGPVRRRGVQWVDHLRTACSALVFGHACFEPVYDVSSGRALLASLAERPQLSLAEIEVDDQGALKSITQYGDVTKPSPDPISADRLLWYSLNREGAVWTGQSMLRPSFGAWLLKQDALRVQATSLRRFGAGTPTARALPGTDPTQAQLDAALAAASNVRVGDTAGSVMPPGFVLEILGVTGSYPDGLPFIRYLDEQMARSALASMLDLGSTSNGSRALGDTFADLFRLAQQAMAETIAETATELCVRLTDYNIGEDAPAPAVVAGDVGSSRKVLATAIADLIKAGALVRDDDLENWIRDALDVPEKSAPTPPPPAALPPAPVPPVTDPAVPPVPAQGAPVAAARHVHAARELTAQEQAAGVDPEAVDNAHAETLAALLTAWVAVQGAQRTALLAQITAAGGLSALAALTVDSSDAATVLGTAMLEAADAGARLAVAEAATQGVTLDPPAVDSVLVEDAASALAEVMGRQTSAAASREALRLAADRGFDPQIVAEGVSTYLDGLTDTWVDDQLGAAVAGGLNTGRAAVFASAPTGTRYFASEVRDSGTCDACLAVDGHEYESWAEAAAAYPTGGYRGCLGRFRCRGIVAAHWPDTPTSAELISLKEFV